jgi:hypothetical protein
VHGLAIVNGVRHPEQHTCWTADNWALECAISRLPRENYTKRDSDDMEFFADAAVGQLIIPRLACFWDSPACFYKMPGVLSVLALLLPRTIPYFQDAPVRIHDWQVS